MPANDHDRPVDVTLAEALMASISLNTGLATLPLTR
jgi:hypothetical protein